jgi:glycosyltransferase involved in cell wall biosynthesis
VKSLHVESGMHLYGGALQVVFLLRGLRALGDDAVLVCPRDSAIAAQARKHVRVREIDMRGDADIGLLGRLRAVIREERPDVVHLHSRRGSDLWGGLAARLEGVPAVLSRRVDNPEPRAWVALKYRLYQRVIAISEGIRRVLLDEGVAPQRVVCVHSAVDTARYRPGCVKPGWLHREFGLPDDHAVLAMVAQFIPRKGHRVLLDALPSVWETHPRTSVLLFGQGPEHSAIAAEVARRGWQARVRLPGFRDDLDLVLPCVDALVHPAAMEGLGVSLLQAAACGVPIVATRAGGIPEVVVDGRNGALVEPGDAVALGAALVRLLGAPELRRCYGEAGRALALERFSLDAMVAGNRAVYHAVMTRPVSATAG